MASLSPHGAAPFSEGSLGGLEQGKLCTDLLTPETGESSAAHTLRDAGRISQSHHEAVCTERPVTASGDRARPLSASVPDCDTCIPSTEHHLGDAEEPRRDRPEARCVSSQVAGDKGPVTAP